jgi:hypothetical protein
MRIHKALKNKRLLFNQQPFKFLLPIFRGKMYNMGFFSLSKIKIGIFLALSAAYFGMEFLKIIENETVRLAEPLQFVLTTVFFLVVFYVIAAVWEYFYFKVRK